LRPQARKLFAHGLRTSPHLRDLDAAGALLSQDHLTLYAGFVEQTQRSVRGGRRGGVAETVRHE
jgi:hypothetical protein